MHCVFAAAFEPLLGTHLLTVRQDHWWHLGHPLRQLRWVVSPGAFALRWWQCLGLAGQSETVSSILATQKSIAVSPLPKRSLQLLGFGLFHRIGTKTFFLSEWVCVTKSIRLWLWQAFVAHLCTYAFLTLSNLFLVRQGSLLMHRMFPAWNKAPKDDFKLESIDFGYLKRFLRVNELVDFGGRTVPLTRSYKPPAWSVFGSWMVQDLSIDSHQAEYHSMGGDGKHLGLQLSWIQKKRCRGSGTLEFFILCHMGGPPKIGGGFPPQIMNFNRGFHGINHPFWRCSPYFWKHPHKETAHWNQIQL